jgi:hypothetical protein
MVPEGPTPAVSDTSMLSALPADGIDTLLGAAGPDSGSSLLMVELRQLGGALARPHPGAGALPMLDGAFVLFAGTIAATPEMGAQGVIESGGVIAAMSPYTNGRAYLNFAENPIDVGRGYGAQEWSALQKIRSSVDPTGLFVANHGITNRSDT